MTDHMTVKGVILAESFAIESKYGTLQINVADLASVRFKPTGATARKVDVTPDFQPPGKWLDTRLDVEKRQQISVQASGTTQASNWNVTSGPNGSNRYSGNTFNKFPTLTLIGKIGKNGKPFKVGAKYKAKAGAKGRLYLSIVAFMYSPASTTGKYTAKIKLGAVR